MSEAEDIAQEDPSVHASHGKTPPIFEVTGTQRNIARFGSPIQRREEISLRYYFYPTWRSQMGPLCWFLVTSILCIILSDSVDWLTIRGRLISTASTTYYLHLPILVLLPGFLLGKALVGMYDSRFIVDYRGVEAQVGLVSLLLRQPRLRFEDIRGVEPEQTIWQRMLNIGDVAIGSAMTEGVEILMRGVADPRAIQLFISSEMEKRLRSLTQSGNGGGYMTAVRGD